ncbi:MAG: hypothetical protein GX629_06710 [Phycisphaerae bacterium]|jgi:hypothetical protein|nr:hypothetical protein [Phycisphaerae bacterium]
MMLNIQKLQVLTGLVIISLANVGWGQVSSGLRSRSSNSSLNTIGSLRTFYGSGISNLNSYGGKFSAKQTPNSSLLQPSGSYGGSNTLGKPRGLNFGGGIGLSPLNRGGLGGQASTHTSNIFNNPRFSGGASYWNLSNESVLGDLQSESVILLPMTSQEVSQQQWQVSAEQAIKPFDDKKLHKPAPRVQQESSSENIEGVSEPMFIPAGAESVKIIDDSGRLYVAQQLSMARGFTRRGQYDQAINSYQAARTVDSTNTNALIGTIFCHIMTNKLLAGGLNVLALSNQDPDFWQGTPDFAAALGISESQVHQAISSIEPEIEKYMDIYRAQDSKEVAENIRLVYLSKMFLSWLKGDPHGMTIHIEAAAQATPLDAEVQRLCRGIAGCEQQQDIKFVPIKPLE